MRQLLLTCISGILLTVFLGTPLSAAAEEHVHQHPVAPVESPAASEVGVSEHLGGKLPLDLTFRDESGKTVRLGDLIDGPTLILPVYYRCTNVCNFLQGGLAHTLPQVKRTPGSDYRVISISFDETETPELAAKNQRLYLDAMGTPFPPAGWRFLTGDAAAIQALTAAAGYRFRRVNADFVHPVASFVVSRDGTIVRYLYGTSFLPKDLTLAFTEAAEGRIGATVRGVVSFCFTYDPGQRTYVFNLLRVAATVVMLTSGSFLAFLIITGRKKRPPEDS